MIRFAGVLVLVWTMTVILVSAASPVFAQGFSGEKYEGSGKEEGGKVIGIPNPLCPPGQPDCERSSILGVMDIILGAILWIATPLAVFFIIIAAFKILNSGGEVAAVKQAREQIIWVCIGYAIILVSKSIVSEVVRIINNPTL